jgi:ribose 1,5-bisphosphate isomerase
MSQTDPEVHPTVEDVAEDIATMEIRGAATIADAAAEALAAQAEDSDATDPEAFRAEMRTAARRLRETRPTAVSLPNALRYVLRAMDGDSVEELRESVRAGAEEFRTELDQAQENLGRIGANRLRDGDTVMTHCHSTDALSCVEHALEQGKEIHAIVKETRPRKQGHITARWLRDMDVPVTLIVDNAARRYLDQTDHVLVGADSIAATMTGHTVEIEMRDEREVLTLDEEDEIGDVTVENPAFDVTPPRYVDAIVTERGQFPPESIVTLMRELFGDQQGGEPWEK